MSVKKKVIILVSVCFIILVLAFVADRILGKSYFVELKYDELMKKIENKESFVLLVSQTDCTHCIHYKPKLKEVANDKKVYIYYIDVDLLSENENKKVNSYISYSSTPVTVFIKEGAETTAANRINGDASKDKIEKKLKSNGFID